MIKKAILTKGLIASGKSSWAKQFVKDNKDYMRLSRDDFRHMLDSYSYSDEAEAVVTRIMNACLADLIDRDKNIIIDEQHLNEKFLNARIAQLEGRRYEVEVKEFPITLGEAIERDSKREFSIGAGVIKKTWRMYELTLKDMLERAKPVYPWNDKLPYVGIIDIDGTLSDSSQRKIFDYKECVNDKIIFPVWSIADKYKDKIKIILLSGRDEVCRKETEIWLEKHAVNYQELYMRKMGDNRDDTVVKKELFNEHIRDKYMPIFVIDDRKKVVEMWIEMGLYVFDVSQDPYAKNPF